MEYKLIQAAIEDKGCGYKSDEDNKALYAEYKVFCEELWSLKEFGSGIEITEAVKQEFESRVRPRTKELDGILKAFQMTNIYHFMKNCIFMLDID